MLGVGVIDYDFTRRVANANTVARGKRRGELTFASIAAGLEQQTGAMRWSAYGRIEGLKVKLDAYAESGAGLFDLTYRERRFDSLIGVLGGTLEKELQVRYGVLTPYSRFELQHDFMSVDAQTVHYSDWLTGEGYLVSADGWARTRASLGIGAELGLRRGWSLSTDVTGELAEGQAMGTLRLGATRSF